MNSRDKILEKVKQLRKYFDELQELDKISGNIPEKYFKYSRERLLHLLLESVFDLGNMIIAFYNWETPEQYKDIFDILQKNHFINIELSEDLKKAAGFRNILVHDYVNVRQSYIDDIVKNHLDDFSEFIKIVVKEFKV